MVQIFRYILRHFDVPLYSVICKRKEGQGKHNWLWNNDILIPWKYVPDVELRWQSWLKLSLLTEHPRALRHIKTPLFNTMRIASALKLLSMMERVLQCSHENS